MSKVNIYQWLMWPTQNEIPESCTGVLLGGRLLLQRFKKYRQWKHRLKQHEWLIKGAKQSAMAPFLFTLVSHSAESAHYLHSHQPQMSSFSAMIRPATTKALCETRGGAAASRGLPEGTHLWAGLHSSPLKFTGAWLISVQNQQLPVKERVLEIGGRGVR